MEVVWKRCRLLCDRCHLGSGVDRVVGTDRHDRRVVRGIDRIDRHGTEGNMLAENRITTWRPWLGSSLGTILPNR